jgi:hypothetical protein
MALKTFSDMAFFTRVLMVSSLFSQYILLVLGVMYPVMCMMA